MHLAVVGEKEIPVATVCTRQTDRQTEGNALSRIGQEHNK